MLEHLLALLPELALATGQTLGMLGIGLAAALVFGGPLGILMYLVGDGQSLAGGKPARALRWTVDMLRHFPFTVLLVALAPFARLVVGSSVGPLAACVPLSVAAIPCFARLVERTLARVPRGIIETAQAMGATELQVVTRVLLVEVRPALVLALASLAVAFLSWVAAAGAVDGGGLGALAVRHGRYQFETDILMFTVAVLVVLVQVIQLTGATLARRLDKGQRVGTGCPPYAGNHADS